MLFAALKCTTFALEILYMQGVTFWERLWYIKNEVNYLNLRERRYRHGKRIFVGGGRSQEGFG